MTDIMNIPQHIDTEPDIYSMFRTIVENASEVYGQDLFFTFGPRQEIIESLVSMSKSKVSSDKKYPLIAIVGNVPVEVGDLTIYGEITLNIIIATLSDINTKAEQRNEKKFVSILQPIYKIFIEAIYDSNLFSTAYDPKLKHQQLLNFDYAKNRLQFENSASPDIIDAIEIKNIKLKIKK